MEEVVYHCMLNLDSSDWVEETGDSLVRRVQKERGDWGRCDKESLKGKRLGLGLSNGEVEVTKIGDRHVAPTHHM